MKRTLISTERITILDKIVDVRFYKEEEKKTNYVMFSFELSSFFKNEDDIDICYPANSASTFDGMKSRLLEYKNRFTNIIAEEYNTIFYV